jgi:hypothetical protein
MRLTQLVVDRQSALRGRECQRHHFTWWRSFDRRARDGQQHICFGDAGVRERVLRVELHGALEALDRLAHRFPGATAQPEAPAQIEVVRFGVLRRSPGQRVSFLSRELGCQRVGDALGNRILDCEDIRRRFVELVGPQRSLRRHVDQLHRHSHLRCRSAN